MNNGSSVKKLLNFFVKFLEACKEKNFTNYRPIDILMEVFLCDNEDDVFSIYPMLLNQSKFAFDYLMQNTNHDKQDLDEVKSHIESAVNRSRGTLYIVQTHEKLCSMYLDGRIFKLFRSFSNGLATEDDNIAQEDIEKIIESINELINELEGKKMNFGDKLYLQNLLKKIILTLKNYDKFSLSDDLSGDLFSLYGNITVNDDLKKDNSIIKKVEDLVRGILHTMKPNKIKAFAEVNTGFFKAGIDADWKSS